MDREDYTDPICPFCTDMFKKNIKPIPTGRVISKLDEYFGKNDYLGAERHLLYWLTEAESEGDLNGEFTVRNELMGLYRKIGKMDKALEHTRTVLDLITKMGNEGSISAGTAYLNAGTAFKAADNPEKSIEFFKMAQAIYEKHLEEDDSRLAGLYNNMALTLTSLKDYDTARNYYKKAIAIMKNKENGLLDCAISYLNMADTEEAEFGMENAEDKINLLIKKATDALESKENEHNGYYAFVCEKCASTFGYYGYFAYENELKERARRIYEGT